MVLPEELCQRLAALAEQDSRTVSNMAKVLIQQGVARLEQARLGSEAGPTASAADLRRQLESQERQRTPRLRGAPRRLRLQRPGPSGGG